MEEKKEKDAIDLGLIAKILYEKRKKFFIMWPIVTALSILWIIPQPRYYNCSVSLAPESNGNDVGGGLASMASSFGINLGGNGGDAIYPLLYPDLLGSNKFIVSLFDIRVKTDDGTVDTDYYTYLTKHQKKNWLTQPFKKAKNAIVNLFVSEEKTVGGKGKKIDSFRLSERDYKLVELVKTNITCDVDKKPDVVTITVQDQDRLVSAILADSVKQRLQNFIIEYRTSKARLDLDHYEELAASAKKDYEVSVAKYREYCDANQDIVLQSSISERDKLEADMQLKYNTYNALCTQVEVAKAKMQERTPAFTTLKTATVPIKPAGPKRMIFVAGMLFFSTFVLALWLSRKILITQA